MSDVLLFDRPEKHVVRLRINRPDKRNAIDLAVREAMMEALANAIADETTRAIVIGGVGGVFSAGGDLDTMAGLDSAGAHARLQNIHRLCRQVSELPVPVVSAIEGVGVGGAIGLALLGDYIVVGEKTRILFPFLNIGVSPDWGQLLTLPRRIGWPQARRVLWSGAAISGPEAFRIGLADELAEDAVVMDAAIRKAVELADLPADAFARMKARLEHPAQSLSEELVREERDLVNALLGSEFAEGISAFQNKRKPDFTRISRKGST